MARNLQPRPSRPRTMDAGNLAGLIAAYAAKLEALGYSKLTVTPLNTDPARHFAMWLQLSNINLADVTESVVDLFGQHVCRCIHSRRAPSPSRQYMNRLRRFLAFLADRGLIVPLVVPSAEMADVRVVEFMHWLKCHRGVSDSTAQGRGQMVMRLLPALGYDPNLYDAALIRATILAETKNLSRSLTKSMTSALRCYLRFLSGIGVCRPGIESAVPRIPEWRLSSLPRYLPADDVERVIMSCDLTTSHGIRDRAILLLLARLGLRVGDVFTLKLDEIDWAAGSIVVKGKGRREVRLPLPQDVGDAILFYLENARPQVKEDRLFLRLCAPYDLLRSSTTISVVVKRALERAGISDPPSWGGNLLRHSAATSMLRGGATLQSVGTVLRHRSLDMTAHYAKVDLLMLQSVAQPWPGEWPC